MECLRSCLPCFFRQPYEVDIGVDVDVEEPEPYQLMETVIDSPEKLANNRDNIRHMIDHLIKNGRYKIDPDQAISEELITHVQNLLQENVRNNNKGRKLFHLNEGYWYELCQVNHNSIELYNGYFNHKTDKFEQHGLIGTFPDRNLGDFG